MLHKRKPLCGHPDGERLDLRSHTGVMPESRPPKGKPPEPSKRLPRVSLSWSIDNTPIPEIKKCAVLREFRITRTFSSDFSFNPIRCFSSIVISPILSKHTKHSNIPRFYCIFKGIKIAKVYLLLADFYSCPEFAPWRIITHATDTGSIIFLQRLFIWFC